MIQASGCRFVRMNLYSQVIETTLGHYNFSEYNAIDALSLTVRRTASA